MQSEIKFGSAIIISLWFCALGIIIAYFISLLFAFAAFVFIVIWLLLFGVYFTFYLCTFKMHIAKGHVSLHHGIIFKFTHRVPIRFVCSCRILTTPLLRKKNSCIIILFYAGGFIIFPGANNEFANLLLQKTVKNNKF